MTLLPYLTMFIVNVDFLYAESATLIGLVSLCFFHRLEIDSLVTFITIFRGIGDY